MSEGTHFPTLLSEFVYTRTYARWLDGEKRRETWPETVSRYVGYIFKGKDVPEGLAELAEKLILNFDVLPSMRALWCAGETVDRDHVSAFNCMGEETEFITRQGVRRFTDFEDGDKVTVLTHTGAWKPAVVHSYGQQQLFNVTLVRGRSEYTVRATRDHQWVLANGSRTRELRLKDKITRPPQIVGAWDYYSSNPEARNYWAFGFVYGDGTLAKNKDGEYTHSMVRLCGEGKTRFLGRFQELGYSTSSPPTFGGDALAYTGHYLKTLPSIEEDGFENVVAFVRGYLDADGHKNTNGVWPSPFNSIQASKESSIEFIRRVFPTVGAYITQEVDLTGETTNYGVRPKTSKFGLVLGFGDSENSTFSVKDIQESSVETVWCLEVEDDHSFVLPNGIVTGNCSFLPVDNLRAFSETLAVLMNGTGVGFSVEREFVNCLPVIAHPTGDSIDYLIQDSTEGWADAVYFGMVQYHLGHKVNWNYSLIREKGARLKTKGGRASGPEPLKRVLDFAGETIAGAAGRHLKPIEAHDIQCMIAEIVMVGGFRRASLISFSDVDDTEMRDAKDWNKGTFPAIRYMSNNSAVYFERPTSEVFWREWDSLAKSGSGERGFSIVNWSKRSNRPDRDIRSNPCHEIGLRFKRATDPWTGAGGGGQFCNLSAAVMRPHDTLETMTEKVRVATWLGAIQASYTYFPYLRPAWKELCLTGDTKVSLLNGKEEKIRDLVGREGFWVYSYDIKAGKMVPGWAHSVRVTQRDAELVRVTLDSGESFDCTPNHPVLLRSGEYREAGSLTPGDSLRPLYRRLSTVEDEGKNGRVGYEMASTGDGWGFTHALTAGPSNRGACQVCGTELPDNKHWLRHHADFDKRNNEPTNFQWLTRAEHNKLHSDVGSKVLTALWKDPSFRERVRASHWKYFRGTPEYEKMCKENGEFLRDVVTRLWEDPEYRTATLSRMRAGHRAYVQTDQFQEVQGQMLERLWSNPDFVEKFMRGAREGTRRKWTDEKYREKMGAITRGLWTPEFKEKMRPYQSANGKEYGKRNLLAYNLSEKGRTQSGENLQYERTPEHLAEMSERSKKTCHEMWHVKRERVSEVCIHCNPTNHKVLSVERLSHREDVYDLTVDEHHNFALSCGVFVHNCEEDNLLGVDITGQCDNPALSGDEDSMLYLNGIARSTAIVASHRLGTNRPAAVTCGKPSGNCRPWYALTTTNAGILTLQDLFESHPNGHDWAPVQRDIQVLRPGTDSQRVLRTYDNGESPLVRLNLLYGLSVEATPNHKWFVKYRVGPGRKVTDVQDWVCAKDIRPGDVLDVKLGTYTQEAHSKLSVFNSRAWHMAVSAKPIRTPGELSEDLCWFLGYLWGDGAMSPGGFRFRFTDEHTFNLTKVQRILMDQFGLESTLSNPKGRKDYTLEFSSVQLWHWLLENGVFKYDAEGGVDIIPRVVRSSSRGDIIAFMAGLLDSDGWAGYKRKGLGSFIFTTASPLLARHLQDVAWAVGIGIGRSLNSLGPSFQKKREMYLLGCGSQIDPESFGVLLRNSNKVQRAAAGDSFKDWEWRQAKREYHVGRVVSVEETAPVPTFDIEVDVDHWYYAGSVKSHNSSQFVDCASGFHTRYSKFYFRHVRISAKDPLYHLIRDQGVPVFKENGQEHLPDDKVDVWVARFPVKSPDGSKLREHERALEQLERYLQIMRTWCGDKGHNQSATVYVRDDEWKEVGEWLWANFDEVTGLSFLPYDGGAYRLAPYVEINEEEYLAAQKEMPDVDFNLLTHYETRDEGEGAAEPACMGGACDI